MFWHHIAGGLKARCRKLPRDDNHNTMFSRKNKLYENILISDFDDALPFLV